MKSRDIIDSFCHAFAGIGSTVKAERNMKIHVTCAMIVVILGFCLRIEIWEWLVCIAWIAAVMAAELINTAIENTVDMVTKEYNPYAKTAKDAAAGAVLILAIGAAVSGAMIFIPRLWSLLMR